MINTMFGEIDEAILDIKTITLEDNEDRLVQHIEYRYKDSFVYENQEYPASTIVYQFQQIEIKRVNTIFGFMMDVDLLDKHIEEIDNENEFTQCPEYRLKEDFEHNNKKYPAGTLVHRSVHVQLKKNVLADGAAAMFG